MPRAERGAAARWLSTGAFDPALAEALDPAASSDARWRAKKHLAESAIQLPHNDELRLQLRALRLSGRVEPVDAEKILRLAGRLSVDEQRAIGETLLAAELAGGIHPDAAARLDGHLADEIATRAANKRVSKTAIAMYSALSVAGTGVTAGAASVLAGLSFGLDPLRTLAIGVVTLFGVVSTAGCAGYAAIRAVDHGSYGVDD